MKPKLNGSDWKESPSRASQFQSLQPAFSTGLQSKPAMVEVLSRDGIESKKKATTCHPIDDVQDCNLGRIEKFSECESDHSKHLPKRTSSYPALPPRLNQVLMGKSNTLLIMRGTNSPAFTCVPLISPLDSPFDF